MPSGSSSIPSPHGLPAAFSVSYKCRSRTNVCYSSRPRSAISGLKGKPLEAMKPMREKRIRRGGKSKTKKETSKEHIKSCVLFYTNINGFRSKADSSKQLIIEHNVDTIS